MKVLRHISELRRQVKLWRRSDEGIALVPTMGNLHAGHIRLVEQAKIMADRTVVSIFVNPMQFGPSEDYQNYPRTFDEDCRKLEQINLDLLFAPEVAEVYSRPLADLTQVGVPGLSDILCGAVRPGHFAGVATVVCKLFNMVQPDIALFGEKDWQQLIVIRRLVADLNLPIEIVGVPTVREPDGLAMSSRNAYLSATERLTAATLYQTLSAAAQRLSAGERNYQEIAADSWSRLEAAGFRPDYVEIRRAEDFGQPQANDTNLIILAAAWLGRARLIDNYPIDLP